MTVSTPQAPSAARPGIPPRRIETLRLGGGWSARVLAPDGTQRLDAPNPTHQGWAAFLQQLIADPTRIAGAQVLKDSPGVLVLRASVELDNGPLDVVYKHTRPRGASSRLRSWRRPRELRNFARGLQLLDAGVATAAPLAVAWRRSSPQAWLVTQHIPDLLDLDNIVLAQLPRLHGAQLRRAKNALLAAVARYCVQLDQLGIVHHDFKASNLLVANWDAALADIGVTPGDPYSAEQRSNRAPGSDEPRPTLHIFMVDLDGITRPWLRSPQRRWRPIVRLAASLATYPSATRTDRLRFLHALLADGFANRADWKVLAHQLTARVEHYNRASARRKHDKYDGYTG